MSCSFNHFHVLRTDNEVNATDYGATSYCSYCHIILRTPEALSIVFEDHRAYFENRDERGRGLLQ